MRIHWTVGACVGRAERHGWRVCETYRDGSVLLWHRSTRWGIRVLGVSDGTCEIERI